MMDYKEMAEIVTKEVDAILERKKIRAMRIKKVSLAVSGLCAAVIVCVGAWHFSSNMKKPDDSFNNSGIISETETTTANAVTTAKVTTFTFTTTETKAAKTTVKTTTAIATSEVSKNTARTSSSVSVTSVKATSSATKIPSVSSTTKTITTQIQTTGVQNLTTATGIITQSPQTTQTTNLRDAFRDATATVGIKKNGTYVDYEKQNTLIEPERIGERITDSAVTILFSDSTKSVVTMNVYKINDVYMEEAVAVRLMDGYIYTDDFYLFIDPKSSDISSDKQQSTDINENEIISEKLKNDINAGLEKIDVMMWCTFKVDYSKLTSETNKATEEYKKSLDTSIYSVEEINTMAGAFKEEIYQKMYQEAYAAKTKEVCDFIGIDVSEANFTGTTLRCTLTPEQIYRIAGTDLIKGRVIEQSEFGSIEDKG